MLLVTLKKYTFFAQEDIIEYETNRKYAGTSFTDATQVISNIYAEMFGGKISIREDYIKNDASIKRDELGRQGQVCKEIAKYFANQQDRVRNDSESKSGFRANVEIDVKPDKLY